MFRWQRFPWQSRKEKIYEGTEYYVAVDLNLPVLFVDRFCNRLFFRETFSATLNVSIF